MKPLRAVNCHGAAGCCLSVGTVLSLRYSQSCFLCIVSTDSYWLDGICCKVQTVQWPPNVQPQLQSTRRKLVWGCEVNITFNQWVTMSQQNVFKQKTSLFYIPMGKRVSFRKGLNAVTQPQTFIDNNNSTMSTGMPVKQDTWHHWWPFLYTAQS